MNKLEVLGYPFNSILEFIGNGYWCQPQGWHLTLGLVLLVILFMRVFMSRHFMLSKLTALYFSSFIFNNPSYKLFGLQFSEYMGIVGCIGLFFYVIKKPFLRKSMVGYAVLTAAIIFVLHALFVVMINAQPDNYLLESNAMNVTLLRMMLIGKVIVLGLMLISFDLYFADSGSLVWLIQTVVAFGLAAGVVYIFQAGMYYIGGIIPFGMYADAGFTGIPSFGAVSLERGHFLKFFVPLFPFFLWVLVAAKRLWSFILFLMVCLINFSASGLAFLAGYLFLAVLIFRNYFSRIRVLFWFCIGVGTIVISGVVFSRQYLGVMTKIWEIGILGGVNNDAIEVSGRSIQVLSTYLGMHPYGMSYGGSTLRALQGLPDNNLGIFVFLTQLSFFSIPIIFGFIVLIYYVIKSARLCSDQLSYKVFLVGALMPVFIYITEVLWFIPHIWLPLAILYRLAYLKNDSLCLVLEPGKIPALS